MLDSSNSQSSLIGLGMLLLKLTHRGYFMDREAQEIHDQKVVSRLSFFHVTSIFLITAAAAFFTQSLSFRTELTDSILNFLIVIITYVSFKEVSASYTVTFSASYLWLPLRLRKE